MLYLLSLKVFEELSFWCLVVQHLEHQKPGPVLWLLQQSSVTKIQSVIIGKCQSLYYTGKARSVMDTKTKEEIIVYLEAGMAYTYKYHGLLDSITCIVCLHVPWKPNLVLFALH